MYNVFMDNILKLPRDRKIILVTHSGSFHTDEIFASVILDQILSKEGYQFEILRTRDEDIINSADIVYDVGKIYNSEKLRFDHHQNDTTLIRDGIPYSSFGLIWKEFGMILCNQNRNVWVEIDNRLAKPIDAADNGIETYKKVINGLLPVTLYDMTSIFNESWKEVDYDKQDILFFEFLEIAKKYFSRILSVAFDNCDGIDLVKNIYEKTEDKRIIVLDSVLPWEDELSSKSDTMLVVYPSKKNGSLDWHVKGVKESVDSMNRRCMLPLEWGGLSGEELEKTTGVKGVFFCHKTGYICATNSKESAIQIAKITLAKKSN